MKRLIISFSLAAMLCPGGAQTVLTMDRALDIAGANSPEMRTALLNLEKYKLNVIAQRASLKSQFSLSLNPADYSKRRSFDSRLSQWYTNEMFSTSGTFRIDQPVIWTDGVISLVNTFGWQQNNSVVSDTENNNKAFQNDLYLSLKQPLFTYNTRRMELREIELDYENSMIAYALSRLNLERSITNQFYSVYMAQAQLDIAKEELQNAEQNFEIIKNKVDADLSAREELFQAELNLASSQSSMEDAGVSLENSKDQLKQTLGMDLNENLIVMTDIYTKEIFVDSLMANEFALRSRLELRQREITTAKLNNTLIRTKARNEFKGDLNLSIGIMGDNEEFDKIYDSPTQNPRVAISFNIPLFDWGENRARVKAQKTAMVINRIESEEEQKTILMDIRKTLRNLKNNMRQINIAEKNVINAQRTYDLNLEKYRNGDLTGMEISQFQTQLSGKKIALAQAMINYKIELLNMKIQTLYDFENKKSILPDIKSLLKK